MKDAPNRSALSDLLNFEMIERRDGVARVACTIDDRMTNSTGIAHGGILCALMDTACGTAMGFQPSTDERPVMSLSLTTNFVGPIFVGDTITATCRRRGGGKSTLFCDLEVVNQKGDLVGQGLGTFRLRSGDKSEG